MTKVQIITAYVLGAITIVFAYHAYTVYQFKKTLIQHDIAIQQVVSFINSNIEANQPK